MVRTSTEPALRRKRSWRRASRESRQGAVVVLTAFLLIVLLGVLALALDVGYVLVARTDLQRTADSSAMAAAWELIDLGAPGGSTDSAAVIANCRNVAQQYASLNPVCRTAPGIQNNAANDPNGDVVVGYLSNPSDPTVVMSFLDPDSFNAVKVRVRRDTTLNGEVPLFFARILGINSTAAHAEATAAILKEVRGFKAPSDGGTIGLLPFALDIQTWDDMQNGGGADDWTWDAGSEQFVAGPDGVREVNLYPQDTGSGGNRGTVDIGHEGNSTDDLARQILDGVNAEDLAYHGGELQLDSSNELFLNGDPGMSFSVKTQLAAVIGRPSMIPIFSEVIGDGNNAMYTIVKFVGVRVIEVDKTDLGKRVIVQPANVVIDGAIGGDGSDTSDYIYSMVWLVR